MIFINPMTRSNVDIRRSENMKSTASCRMVEMPQKHPAGQPTSAFTLSKIYLHLLGFIMKIPFPQLTETQRSKHLFVLIFMIGVVNPQLTADSMKHRVGVVRVLPSSPIFLISSTSKKAPKDERTQSWIGSKAASTK